MNEIKKKSSLEQAIDLISEIDFDDDDFENIFERFEVVLNNPEFKGILKKINGINGVKINTDLKDILKELTKQLSLEDLNLLLKKVIKNEGLVDFIQDLFLEKLL